MMMVRCLRCDADNRAGSAYCSSCGSKTGSLLTPTPANNQRQILQVGTLLQQRYEILGKIGGGGMGTVWKAYDKRLRQHCAVKSLDVLTLEDVQAFEDEALLLAQLNHPQLPRVTDHFEDGQCWYLVMDFIAGITLEKHLENAGGTLPINEVVRIGIELCHILSYLHNRPQPIIFRDLKPANIILNNNVVYLVDFGIARTFKPGQAKDTRAYGTLGYASPELLAGMQTTPASDVYSLGVVLHELYTGDNPSTNLFQFREVRHQRLRHVVEHQIHRDPMQRFSIKDVEELLLTIWREATATIPQSAPVVSVLSSSPTSTSSEEKIHILFLFHPDDAVMVHKIEVHLAAWKRQAPLAIYHNTNEMGGITENYWCEVIKRCCLFLPFLSPDFVADQNMLNRIEQQILPLCSLGRQKRIIPIRLKPTEDLKEISPLLAEKAGLPNGKKAFSEYDTDTRDRIGIDIMVGIKGGYTNMIAKK